MFGNIIRHRLPVLAVASLLNNQPRPRIKVKDPACFSSEASPKKERAKDVERSEKERSRRHKRKRKRSKRHESVERNKPTKVPKPLDRNNHRGHHHHHRRSHGQGERVVRIPGGPELPVPCGVTHCRVVHEGCRYKLLLYPDTGELRNFSVKKIQD